MAQNNQACLLLQVKMSVCLKLELCDFVSQVQSLEQRTKVLVIRAVFPAMRYRLKLHSCPLYRRNFIKDPLVKGLMWYPKGTQFLLLKYTTKGTEPPLYHFSGECCREVGDDGQVFAFPALGTRLICGTGKNALLLSGARKVEILCICGDCGEGPNGHWRSGMVQAAALVDLTAPIFPSLLLHSCKKPLSRSPNSYFSFLSFMFRFSSASPAIQNTPTIPVIRQP